MRWLVVVALAAMCGACASVTRGTTEDFQIQSEPTGADVRTSLGQTCVTPCTIQVKRKREFTLTASKPGYNSAEMDIKTHVGVGGAVGFTGNVLFGGAIGMGVDAYNGASLDHYPNPAILKLTPLRAGEQPRTLKQQPDLPPPAPPPSASTPTS